VAVERLDPEDRLGRSLRRSYYRARIDEWTAEYRRGRDPELRQQIIDVSIREGLPSDLTALHVAAPDRVLARTATAGPLLRPIGMLLLAIGAVVLILSRRFGT
jgi:hypothetical protein